MASRSLCAPALYACSSAFNADTQCRRSSFVGWSLRRSFSFKAASGVLSGVPIGAAYALCIAARSSEPSIFQTRGHSVRHLLIRYGEHTKSGRRALPSSLHFVLLGKRQKSASERRTGKGRKRAQARGVRFGRPCKLTSYQRQEALQRLAAGETQTDVARTYGLSTSTICRLAADSPFEQSAVGP
jgi:hypothetical protein